MTNLLAEHKQQTAALHVAIAVATKSFTLATHLLSESATALDVGFPSYLIPTHVPEFAHRRIILSAAMDALVKAEPASDTAMEPDPQGTMPDTQATDVLRFKERVIASDHEPRSIRRV